MFYQFNIQQIFYITDGGSNIKLSLNTWMKCVMLSNPLSYAISSLVFSEVFNRSWASRVAFPLAIYEVLVKYFKSLLKVEIDCDILENFASDKLYM